MASIPDATITHTLDTEALPTAVQEIADLARRDAERVPEHYDIHSDPNDRSLLVVKLRQDERLERMDLERFLDVPNRARGTVVVHDPTDFVDVVNRLANVDHTTVWADVRNGTITAVVNDHAGWDMPGWRDHTVQLALRADEDWLRWMQGNNKRLTQTQFAEFLDDVGHTVISPDQATMLEVSRTMQAKKSIQFNQSTRLDNGDVALNYEETTEAKAGQKGNLEVPERITVLLSPWRGVVQAELIARLVWSIQGGQLSIGYKLIRPELFVDEVFAGLIERVRADLINGVPIYRGETPKHP